jgi:hypothetical protein
MNVRFEKALAVLAAALAVWRFALPIERCAVLSGSTLTFVTYRWFPWQAGCNWGSEVDVWGTTVQVVLLLFVGLVAVWVGRTSEPRGRLG